jgi:hypothetical protein
MKYFTLLAAFLPATLAWQIAPTFTVNIMTNIVGLVLIAHDGSTIDSTYPLAKKTLGDGEYNVMSYMHFTETGVPQEYVVHAPDGVRATVRLHQTGTERVNSYMSRYTSASSSLGR